MTTHRVQPTFPFDTPDPGQPPPEYTRLRDEEPVVRVTLPSGDTAWLVTSYEHNMQVLNDPRFSRAATTAPDAPRLLPLPTLPTSLIGMDPPQHTRMRKLVSRAFTARRVESLRGHVRDLAAAMLDGMARQGPPADLVEHLARPLPLQTICVLLGVPAEQRDRFWSIASTLFSLTDHPPETVRQARQDLVDSMTELVASKRTDRGEDLLSSLIDRQEHEEDTLSQEELVGLGCTVIAGGFYTTANQIALSCRSLLLEGEQLRLLREQPELLPQAVEELLRYTPPMVSGGFHRIATEDVELGAVTVRAGEAVVPVLVSANRDGSVFHDPDRLDLTRTDNPHLAFGHGIHYCLGAQLARLELEVALEELLRRFPGLRLAVGDDELQWRPGGLFRGLTALPVAW